MDTSIAPTSDLGLRIERDGIDAISPEQLASVARMARLAGGSEIAAAILVDPTEPRPARERAFGLLEGHLIRASGLGYSLAA